MPIDRRALLAVVLGLLLLPGCGDGPGEQGEISVGAAASLRRVLPDLIERYRGDHPGAAFRVTYASSGTLRTQIEAGAPIDGTLLASERDVDQLVERGHAEADSRTVVARNVLVLVAGPESPATSIADLPSLPAKARVAIGAPGSAPVGRYARDLLRGRGLWDGLQEHLVFARDVSAVVAYVRRGEAAAGFAYATDARDVPELQVLEIADGADDPTPLIVGVAVKQAPGAAEFRSFLGWLATPDAREVLAAHGFGAP